MPLVIGPLDGLGLEMHVGHVLGLKHDLGLGVDPSYKPCWDHINKSKPSQIAHWNRDYEYITNQLLLHQVLGSSSCHQYL